MGDEAEFCYDTLIEWAVDPMLAKLHRYLLKVECGDFDVDDRWLEKLMSNDEAIQKSKVTIE